MLFLTTGFQFFNINNSFLILNIKGGRFCAVCNFCFLPSETFFFRLLSSWAFLPLRWLTQGRQWGVSWSWCICSFPTLLTLAAASSLQTSSKIRCGLLLRPGRLASVGANPLLRWWRGQRAWCFSQPGRAPLSGRPANEAPASEAAKYLVNPSWPSRQSPLESPKNQLNYNNQKTSTKTRTVS